MLPGAEERMAGRGRRERGDDGASKRAASGVVALIFLILGSQLTLFVVKVIERPAREQVAAPTEDAGAEAAPWADSRYAEAPPPGAPAEAEGAPPAGSSRSGRTALGGYPAPETGYPSRSKAPRTYESFTFNPNTVSVQDLVRLGLSERQAEVIDNYRGKGGRFRSVEDFAKMYVVSDTLFERLRPFIDIPKLELNGADTSQLVTLKGIGPYYALKIVEYRERLGGFRSKEQLLEVPGMDEERYAGLSGSVRVDTSAVRPLRLWSMSSDSLARHPYVGSYAAKGIVRFRQVCDSSQWTVDNLVKNGILTGEAGEKLRGYL